jgi:hypothetical protein
MSGYIKVYTVFCMHSVWFIDMGILLLRKACMETEQMYQ